MTVASPFLSDKPSCRGRFYLCRILARVLVLAVIVGIVLAYGVHVRLLEWSAWVQSGLQIQDAWFVAPTGASFDVTVTGQGPLDVPSMIARGVAWVHELTGWSLGSITFWLPVLLGPLAALPPVLLLWAWGYPAGALATGLFIGSVPVFLAKTRLGFCGAEMFNLLFSLLVASLLTAWLTRTRPYTLSRWLVGEELHPVYDPLASVPPGAVYEYSSGAWDQARRTALWRVDTPLFVLAAFGTGLVAWAWMALYPAGKDIVFAMFGVGVLASLWVQRTRLVPALVAQALMIGVTLQPEYAGWALLAVLVTTQMPHMRECCAKISPKVLWLLCLVLGVAGAWLWWPAIVSYGHDVIGFVPGAVLEQAGQPFLDHLWPLFTAHPYLLYAALGGMALGLCLRPALLVFCPLVVLGLGVPWIGVNFVLYGAALGVMFGMGIAFIEGAGGQGWATLSVGRKIWLGTRKVAAWGATLAVCWLMFVSANTVTVVNWEGFERLHSMARARVTRLEATDCTVEGNTVRFGTHAPLPLDGLDVVETNGSISHTPLHAGNGQYAVWNKHTGVVHVLPKKMYDASYVRLLLWDKGQAPVPGFVLVYDALPCMRVFKTATD